MYARLALLLEGEGEGQNRGRGVRVTQGEKLAQERECLLGTQEPLAVGVGLKMLSKLAEGRPAEEAALAVEVEAGRRGDVEVPEARRFSDEAHHLVKASTGAARL